MKVAKKIFKVVFFCILIFLLFLLAVYVNHRIQKSREENLLQPLGQMVEVDGHKMSVYSEGQGAHTLVFLSGGGTCSPILDFKSLYTLLREDNKIVVIEKFGYGYSDIVDKSRDLDSILEDNRQALKAAGIPGPYVVCPHSMSGLEALYWSQKYPEEVEGIIGLDMAVPRYYESMDINLPVIKLASIGAQIGITRLLPNLSQSEAVKYGSLSEKEKEIYQAIFYRSTATKTMIEEMEEVKGNAKKVEQGPLPQTPTLLFLSDASGGTQFDTETWREIPREYFSESEKVKYIELEGPHYIHDHKYQEISEEIKAFLKNDL